MAIVVMGVVKDGVVVPKAPLPEGALVQITVAGGPPLPPEIQEEFDAWNRASDKALELVEESNEEG
jgi:hypothetical protein